MMARRTNLYVYFSHFLSAWGDRMWSFGVGLFLVRIASENLQLPATYGLASGLTIFLLGALVGDWVDSTPRLKAAQLSLVVQNCCVVLCTGVVYAYLQLEGVLAGVKGGWAIPLCHAVVILVAIVSDLASLARVIAVERDWIVKICGSDSDLLAKMTAVLRRIDQTTLILAPVATGQVMTYAGLENGALFIGGWNLASVGLEYYLMWKVYTTVPALSVAKKEAHKDRGSHVESRATKDNQPIETSFSKPPITAKRDGYKGAAYSDASPLLQQNSRRQQTSNAASDGNNGPTSPLLDEAELGDSNNDNRVHVRDCTCCSRLLYQIITLYRGWRTYMHYSVALAGLALASLYMTVLGFDNITVAYGVTQGVSESITGVLMGASAVFGLIGTCVYPPLRRRVGLARTGIIALTFQVSCLALCVVSIWMPGSPFDPLYRTRTSAVNSTPTGMERFSWAEVTAVTGIPMSSSTIDVSVGVGSTTAANPSASGGSLSASAFGPFDSSSEASTPDTLTAIKAVIANLTLANIANESYDVSTSGNWNTTTLEPAAASGPSSYLSVIFLMAGIVLARFGLWMADLSITQMFLEEVEERERGIVNGVQSSLNKLMDVLKFLLVVAVPDTETFGFLIIISYAFICLGWLQYAIFFKKFHHRFDRPERPNVSGYVKL